MATKNTRRKDRSFHGLKRGMEGAFDGLDQTHRVRLRGVYPGGAVITGVNELVHDGRAGQPVLIPRDQFHIPATAIVSGRIKLRPLSP